jgi:hypothetical protein
VTRIRVNLIKLTPLLFYSFNLINFTENFYSRICLNLGKLLFEIFLKKEKLDPQNIIIPERQDPLQVRGIR